MPKRIVVIAVKGHVAAEAWYVLRFRASWSIIVVVGREIFESEQTVWRKEHGKKGKRRSRVGQRDDQGEGMDGREAAQRRLVPPCH